MTHSLNTQNPQTVQLLKLTTNLHTFIIYMRNRRKKQFATLKLNQAMHTHETIQFLKELHYDLNTAILQIENIISETTHSPKQAEDHLSDLFK